MKTRLVWLMVVAALGIGCDEEMAETDAGGGGGRGGLFGGHGVPRAGGAR